MSRRSDGGRRALNHAERMRERDEERVREAINPYQFPEDFEDEVEAELDRLQHERETASWEQSQRDRARNKAAKEGST